jgi:hypothetical protein
MVQWISGGKSDDSRWNRQHIILQWPARLGRGWFLFQLWLQAQARRVKPTVWGYTKTGQVGKLFVKAGSAARVEPRALVDLGAAVWH